MHVITRCVTERLLRRRIINDNVPQKVCNQEAAEEIDEKSTTLLRENASASAFRIFPIESATSLPLIPQKTHSPEIQREKTDSI